MDKALYVAMTGARASLQAQGTLSHNLANSDTPGFKEALANTEAFPIKGPGFASRVDALHVDAGFNRTPGSQHHRQAAGSVPADRHLAGRAVQRRQ